MINMQYVDSVIKEAEELNKQVAKTLRREDAIKEIQKEEEEIKVKIKVNKKQVYYLR